MVPSASPTSGPSSVLGVATWSVVSVVDGDTLEVSGSDGDMTVRLIGVNAPEDGECLADEATEALRDLAARPVVLLSDRTDTDQYGRALRYVETPSGVDVGGELVRRGLAISRRYEPDTARNDRYDALQDEAVADAAGVWRPEACGPAAVQVSIEVDVQYDAAGDDNDNLNDEWVRFTNTGSAPVDLDGWIVADESASHRYTFQSLALAPAASVTLFTGCGTDTDAERYWCNTGSAVWNNAGDAVFLRDPNGNNVVVHPYGG